MRKLLLEKSLAGVAHTLNAGAFGFFLFALYNIASLSIKAITQ